MFAQESRWNQNVPPCWRGSAPLLEALGAGYFNNLLAFHAVILSLPAPQPSIL